MKLESEFESFLNNISLGATPRGRIESAVTGLTDFLAGSYEIGGGEVASRIFMQGSFPNGTAIEPIKASGGEYDVDLIIVIDDVTVTADGALNDLTKRLSENGNYKDRISMPKRPCVRLAYAEDEIGKFHVDLVPARLPATDASTRAPLEVPRRLDGWHGSAPAEFTEWAKSQGDRFARTVQILKRWRDEHQSARSSIKSIVLQVLVSEQLGSDTDDASSVEGVLNRIHSRLEHESSPPELLNPVLPEEDLAARWTQGSFDDFKKVIAECSQLATQALLSADLADSHEMWQKLLGDDFPPGPGMPAQRVRVAPLTPAPGFQERKQDPPKRERYG